MMMELADAQDFLDAMANIRRIASTLIQDGIIPSWLEIEAIATQIDNQFQARLSSLRDVVEEQENNERSKF